MHVPLSTKQYKLVPASAETQCISGAVLVGWQPIGRRRSWWPTGTGPASLIPVVAVVFHLRFVRCLNEYLLLLLLLLTTRRRRMKKEECLSVDGKPPASSSFMCRITAMNLFCQSTPRRTTLKVSTFARRAFSVADLGPRVELAGKFHEKTAC